MPRRRRRGLGLVALLAIGAALFVGISIVATGGRGLGFTDDGFLRRPWAPESSSGPPPAVAPHAPAGATDLTALRQAVQEAQRALQEALEAGDPAAIRTRQEALATAQAALAGARAAAAP